MTGMRREQVYIDMMATDWRKTVRPARIPDLERRIRLTTSCRDCDGLPRAPHAGACIVDGGGNAVQIMHNGLKVLYGRYYGPWINAIIAGLDGVHEPQEERVFHEVLNHIPAGSTMVEAGAYWGYYAMWFARAVPQARTFLIEPDPLHMRVAVRNFVVNRLKGDFTAGCFGGYPEHKYRAQQARGAAVPCFSVPTFMELKGLRHITLLHADIQGYEEDMLDGAGDLLASRRIDWIFVSTHGRRHRPCRDILTGAGYRMVAEHDIAESASADGLLVAQSPDLPAIPPVPVSRLGAGREHLALAGGGRGPTGAGWT